MNKFYDWLARATYRLETCNVCRNLNSETCAKCGGWGRYPKIDIFEKAVGWDLWVANQFGWMPWPARYLLHSLVNPLCQVAVRRWNWHPLTMVG